MNVAQTTETASRVVIIVWVATAVHVQEGTHLWRMVDPVQVINIIHKFLIFISLWEARRPSINALESGVVLVSLMTAVN